MYQYVPRKQILDVLKHARDLFRQAEPPTNERERLIAERRQIVSKYIISNLARTGTHPTLKTVMEVVDAFLFTVGAAHELFGYDLDAIRESDLRLNSGRTHIIESYVFDRHKLIDIPLDLAPEPVFRSDARFSDLVRVWQPGVPIRAFDELEGHDAAFFYLQIGTEDSRTSSLPPGSVALIEPISTVEAERPNPRLIYLLQFHDGYRCSRCVITHGKLQMLTSGRVYIRPREFTCPGQVRVAGRVRMFAHALPQPEFAPGDLPQSARQLANLKLPWEQGSTAEIFLNEHRRFRRSRREEIKIREILSHLLDSPLTKRTERRYRETTSSEPHVSTLIQLTVLHFARYSDSLHIRNPLINDRGHFSLDEIVDARIMQDLPLRATVQPVRPEAAWSAWREEYLNWMPLISFKFPELNVQRDTIVRLSQSQVQADLHPVIAAGSWMLLQPIDPTSDTLRDREKRGWSRPLYALRRDLHFLTGYLEQDGSGYTLLSNPAGTPRKDRIPLRDFSSLRRVTGVAVPV